MNNSMTKSRLDAFRNALEAVGDSGTLANTLDSFLMWKEFIQDSRSKFVLLSGLRQHQADFENLCRNLMNHLVDASLDDCTCLVLAIDTLDVFFVGLAEDARSELCLMNAEVLKDASDLLQ